MPVGSRAGFYAPLVGLLGLLLLSACQKPEPPSARVDFTTPCQDFKANVANSSLPPEVRKAIAEGRSSVGQTKLPRCEDDTIPPIPAIVICEWFGSFCTITVCTDVACTGLPSDATNICDCFEGLCWHQLPRYCQ